MDMYINNTSGVEVKYKVKTWDDPDGISGSVEALNSTFITVTGNAEVYFTNSKSGKESYVAAGYDRPNQIGIATYIDFDDGVEYEERALWSTSE